METRDSLHKEWKSTGAEKMRQYLNDSDSDEEK